MSDLNDSITYDNLGEMMRPASAIPFQFVGTTSKRVEFCPEEFEGKAVASITEEIRGVLRSIDSSVDYFEDDIVQAASELAAAGR